MAKILITGARGFIGSHLTEYLVEKGHKVKHLSAIVLVSGDGIIRENRFSL